MALPNAEIMIHQPLGGVKGQAEDIKIHADWILKTREKLNRIMAENSGQDVYKRQVEVKFYNMKVDVDRDLGTGISGLYAIGDGSGVTHSLSQASASGVYVARKLNEKYSGF